MADTPQHTYQLLTKRARRLHRIADKLPWPANVWIGVSVEDEKVFHRVDDLREVRTSSLLVVRAPFGIDEWSEFRGDRMAHRGR
jgi:protein gp37